MKIVFTDLVTEGNTFAKPQPATKVLPEWYKNLQHYSPDNKKRAVSGTPYGGNGGGAGSNTEYYGPNGGGGAWSIPADSVSNGGTGGSSTILVYIK
jgi:hypothetical protein